MMNKFIFTSLLFFCVQAQAQKLISVTESIRIIYPVIANSAAQASRGEFIPDTEQTYTQDQIESQETAFKVNASDTVELILAEEVGQLVILYPSCAPKNGHTLALYSPPESVILLPAQVKDGKEIYRFKVKSKIACATNGFRLSLGPTATIDESISFLINAP